MSEAETAQQQGGRLRVLSYFNPASLLARRQQRQVAVNDSCDADTVEPEPAAEARPAHVQMLESFQQRFVGAVDQAVDVLTSFVNGDEEDESCTCKTLGFAPEVRPYNVEGNSIASMAGTRQASTQALTTTGTKQWGSWWDGRGLLRVKIYDFAIYTNKSQLTNTKLQPDHDASSGTGPDGQQRRRFRLRRRKSKGKTPLCERVLLEPSVEMSLSVRPTRDLPLMIMRNEYKRILSKRLRMVGGDPEDAGLHTLMEYFDPVKLPDDATRRGCIRKGTVLHFSRDPKGQLTAVANRELLTTVQSKKLCEAVFDLYLGDPPVCKRARDVAAKSLNEMLSQPVSTMTVKP